MGDAERELLANGFGDLWVKDLERGTKLRLTSDPGWEYSPLFWPDGSKIAFTWYRSQPYSFHVAIKPANGLGPEELILEKHTPSGCRMFPRTEHSSSIARTALPAPSGFCH